MAQTKVSLIKDQVIDLSHFKPEHGITTDHIGEGSTRQYFTESRVQNILTTNNYIKTSDVANLETVTSLSINANVLSYTNEAGVTTNIDLSVYLDDSNLARIVSGSLNSGTGVATFTRDDSSTFTVDFSAFLSDANDYVTSASFNTTSGVLTLTRLGGGTVTVDLDGKYSVIGHTHSWSEIASRPTALSDFTNDLGNYGGFLTSFTETDPTVPSHVKSITSTNISNWNTAYGWGNHASAGYLTSLPSHTHDYVPERSRTDWNDNTVINDVIGQLAWKNYGNNHTIFDASAGTSPSGTSVNNTNSTYAWSATYPTLMGWNGAHTYGVRVDSSRVSDSTNSVSWSNISGKPSTFAPSAHNHDDRYYTESESDVRFAPISHSHPYLSDNSDSEQTIGSKVNYFNVGGLRMNMDPRWNEGGYDGDNGNLHIWSTRADGGNYGRAGIALYNGSAYQYLTTKGSQNALYHNNNEIITSATIGSQSVSYSNSTGSVAWSNVSGKPSTFAPSSHDHDRAFITDTRGAVRAPSYYDDRYVQWDFQNTADTGAAGDGWHVLQTISPWSVYNNSHRQQQLVFTGTGGIKFRYASSESEWTGWQTLWTSGNDGSGSGLDADLLDGYHASSFLTTGSTATNIGEARFAHTTYTDPNPGVTRDAKFGDSGIAASESYVVGISSAGGSFRAPIFYDSNDTNLYVDPTGTSVLNYVTATEYKFRSSTNNARFNGVSDWGTRLYTDGGYIQFGPANTGHAHIYTDRANFYFNKQLTVNGGSQINSGDMRASTFYDLDDTNFFMNPAGDNRMHTIISNYFERANHHIGHFVGSYNNIGDNSTNTNPIYTIGGNYNPALTSLSNMYGIGFCNASASFITMTGAASWGMYVAADGDARVWLDGSQGRISATGAAYVPIYYDSNDTTYYVDPSSTSNFSGLTVASQISGSISGASNALASTSYGNGNFTWRQSSGVFDVFSGWHNYLISNHGDGSSYYNTIIAMPFWGPPRYSRLEGGTQRGPYEFWTSERNIDSSYDVRATLFYDSNNTGYYVDPASTSVLSKIQISNVSSAPYINLEGTRGMGLWGVSSIGMRTITDTWSDPNYHGIRSTSTAASWGDDISINSYHDITMRIDSNGNNADGAFRIYTDTTSSSNLRFFFDYAGTGQATGSFRAPIFYDSNNTAYYVDPASGSYLSGANSINVAPESGVGLKIQGGSNGGHALVLNGGGYSSAGEVTFPNYATGISMINTGSFAQNAFNFNYGTGVSSNVGSIRINSTSTSYITSSDYRLKENLVEITDGIDRLKLLKPKRFNFIGHEEVVDGFVAHEAQEVVPESVTGEKDAIGWDGNPEYQGIDQSKLVPLLTAAIQEAVAKIESLESRIQALEEK